MKGFTDYLTRKGLSATTARMKQKQVALFKDWWQQHELPLSQCTHTYLIEFLDYCRTERAYSHNTVLQTLASLRAYFAYLGFQPNPTDGIRLGRRPALLPRVPVEAAGLEQFYRAYPKHLLHYAVLAGLLLFQALRRREMAALHKEDVDLERTLLHVPAATRTNARTLHLHQLQLPELQAYLEPMPAQAPLFDPPKLLLGMNYLNYQLRRIPTELQGTQHIRSSRYADWLRRHNLRQVQYLAGHRYVSSTEHYQSTRLEDLQAQLQKYHPLHRSE